MQIVIKNKDTLLYEEFKFKCSIGRNGISSNKVEGDRKTPRGIYSLGPVYFRYDRIDEPISKLKKIKIKKNMGWCDDTDSKYYNKLIKTNMPIKHEKLFRNSQIYDIFIPIKYNTFKTKKNKGSAIFLHLTKNYKKTLGCISLKKRDMIILLKLINKKTKIKII